MPKKKSVRVQSNYSQFTFHDEGTKTVAVRLTVNYSEFPFSYAQVQRMAALFNGALDALDINATCIIEEKV